MSAALTIRSSEAHTRLRDLATDALRDELGLLASLGRVQLELVPLGIVARDVALDDPVYGRLADAERIVIRPSFAALLRGAVDLEEIELSGAHVHLMIRDGQLRNVPRIDTGDGGDGGIQLPFDRLRIVDATLSVDAEPLVSGELQGVTVTVEAVPGNAIAIAASIPEGHVVREDVRYDLRVPDARVVLTADSLRVDEAALHAGPLHLAVHDAVVPMPPPDPLARDVSGYRGRVELDYDLANLAALRLPITLPEMQGHVAIRAEVLDDPSTGQRAVGTVQVDHGQIREFGLGDTVRLPFEANHDLVRVSGGEIRIVREGGRLGLEATLGLTPELPLDARVTVRGLSFAKLMHQLGVSQQSIVEWIFEGTMNLAGSLRDVDISGPIDLRTHDFVVSANPYFARPLETVIAIPRGHFRGSWSIRPEGIRFRDLVADLPHSRIFGDVLLGFDNALRVEARAAPADLRDVSPLSTFRMGGIGTASVHIDGRFQDPHVSGHVRIADFVFDSFRLGDVESDATLDSDGMAVTFPHVTAVKDQSRYFADDVYLDFRRNRFRMAGRLRLERMRLHDFYHVFGFEEDERFTPYQGFARGHAQVEFTSGYPGDSPSGTVNVEMALSLPEVTLDGYRFTDGEMAGRFRWLDRSRGIAGAHLELDYVSLRKGEGTVALAGDMLLGGTLRMTAAADALALRDLEGIGDRFPGLEGIATATAQVGGTASEMRVDLDIGIANLVYAGRALGEGRFYVRMTPQSDPWVQDALRWEATPPADEPCALARMGLARANWPADPPLRTVDGLEARLPRPSAFLVCGTALDGRMTVDLAAGRTTRLPLRGRIAIDDLDLARFLPTTMLPGAGSSHGTLSAELAFTDGGIRDLGSLGARLTVRELALGRGDLVVTNRGPIVVAMSDGVAVFERARLSGPETQLRVRGQYALPTTTTDGGLALSVEAQVGLGVLPRVTSAVTEASGEATARLAISGPIADPAIYGEAQVSGGTVRASALPTPVEDLTAHVTFSARSIQIDELRGRVAGGSVRGRGAAQIADGALDRWSLRLHADDLALAPFDGLELALSSDLAVDWTRGERLPIARGEVRISRLAFSRNIDLGATLGDLSRTQRATVERYDPAADRLALDLRIVDEQPFVVRNNLVEAEMVIDDSQRPFRIVGTDQRFGVLGNVHFTRGRIFFRNSVFDLRSGALSFDDETRIDPTFRVDAVSEIRRSGDLAGARWRIMLDARGSLDAFQIATRSDPDLPQEDILMLLAIGMTRNEFEQLRTGDLTSTAALEALTQLSGVDREVRRAVPLIDDFRITSAYSLRSGRTEPQVSVGKRIADRVRVSATTGVGAGSGRDFRAVLDMQLDDTTGVQCSYDNFTTSGGASTFGNVGCDLRWRLEFE